MNSTQKCEDAYPVTFHFSPRWLGGEMVTQARLHEDGAGRLFTSLVMSQRAFMWTRVLFAVFLWAHSLKVAVTGKYRQSNRSIPRQSNQKSRHPPSYLTPSASNFSEMYRFETVWGGLFLYRWVSEVVVLFQTLWWTWAALETVKYYRRVVSGKGFYIPWTRSRQAMNIAAELSLPCCVITGTGYWLLGHAQYKSSPYYNALDAFNSHTTILIIWTIDFTLNRVSFDKAHLKWGLVPIMATIIHQLSLFLILGEAVYPETGNWIGGISSGIAITVVGYLCFRLGIFLTDVRDRLRDDCEAELDEFLRGIIGYTVKTQEVKSVDLGSPLSATALINDEESEFSGSRV